MSALLGLVLFAGCPPSSSNPRPPGGPTRLAGFGTGGVVVVDPSPFADVARAVSGHPSNGFIIVVGSDEAPGAGDSQWRIEKRDFSGALDANFGTAGVITVNPGSGPDAAVAVLVDPVPGGTYFWVAGTDSSPGAGDTQWRIEMRRQSDGALALGFGTNGVLTVNPSTGRDDLTAFTALSGALYLVGTDEGAGAGDTMWRIEKRSVLTGALDTGFGSFGVIRSNPSSGLDAPSCVIYPWAGGTLYVGGYDSLQGDRQWRVEARSSSGAPVTGFGTNGIVTANPSGGSDEVTALGLDGPNMSYLFALGWDESPGSGDTQWRVERRSVLDGSLSTGFGAGGSLTLNPSQGSDRLVAAIVFEGLLVVGVDFAPSTGGADGQWRLGGASTDGTWGWTPPFRFSDPTLGADTPFGLWYAGGGGFFVVGCEVPSPNSRWRIEAWGP